LGVPKTVGDWECMPDLKRSSWVMDLLTSTICLRMIRFFIAKMKSIKVTIYYLLILVSFQSQVEYSNKTKFSPVNNKFIQYHFKSL
jgi:hypothetical protein